MTGVPHLHGSHGVLPIVTSRLYGCPGTSARLANLKHLHQQRGSEAHAAMHFEHAVTMRHSGMLFASTRVWAHLTKSTVRIIFIVLLVVMLNHALAKNVAGRRPGPTAPTRSMPNFLALTALNWSCF